LKLGARQPLRSSSAKIENGIFIEKVTLLRISGKIPDKRDRLFQAVGVAVVTLDVCVRIFLTWIDCPLFVKKQFTLAFEQISWEWNDDDVSQAINVGVGSLTIICS
jgi:hypothetical protein